ncbi:hypothetical protein CEV31_3824 [Brucella thiophenivorans]|uniref:Uncharacterized protein n=1 Tax=Brucella thiophenivorans TaxID=571255 RepID=A0A256F9N1_9HYPH|nr:hypothetical protein CEV31_3824 [Brucella thiophenivorans]
MDAFRLNTLVRCPIRNNEAKTSQIVSRLHWFKSEENFQIVSFGRLGKFVSSILNGDDQDQMQATTPTH